MPRQRVLLSDQALVAVTAARRQRAQPAADALDLLVGLVSDPEGGVGRAWAAHGPALLERTRRARPTLPPLDVALRWAVETCPADRPLWTTDLAGATREVGGSALAESIDGIALEPLAPVDLDPLRAGGLHARETFGLGAPDGFDALGGLCVARSRGAGGGPLHLLLTLAVDAPETLGGAAETLQVVWHRQRRGEPWDAVTRPSGDKPAALDDVLAGARRLAQGTAGAEELASAMLLLGGAAPTALLDTAHAELRVAGAET